MAADAALRFFDPEIPGQFKIWTGKVKGEAGFCQVETWVGLDWTGRIGQRNAVATVFARKKLQAAIRLAYFVRIRTSLERPPSRGFSQPWQSISPR